MEVVPASVGEAARQWDEQHLDLQAAAGQVGGAGSGGFTSAVSGAASRFLTGWERHVEALGVTCEGRADGLRATITDFLATDAATAAVYLVLQQYTFEDR